MEPIVGTECEKIGTLGQLRQDGGRCVGQLMVRSYLFQLMQMLVEPQTKMQQAMGFQEEEATVLDEAKCSMGVRNSISTTFEHLQTNEHGA